MNENLEQLQPHGQFDLERQRIRVSLRGTENLKLARLHIEDPKIAPVLSVVAPKPEAPIVPELEKVEQPTAEDALADIRRRIQEIES